MHCTVLHCSIILPGQRRSFIGAFTAWHHIAFRFESEIRFNSIRFDLTMSDEIKESKEPTSSTSTSTSSTQPSSISSTSRPSNTTRIHNKRANKPGVNQLRQAVDASSPTASSSSISQSQSTAVEPARPSLHAQANQSISPAASLLPAIESHPSSSDALADAARRDSASSIRVASGALQHDAPAGLASDDAHSDVAVERASAVGVPTGAVATAALPSSDSKRGSAQHTPRSDVKSPASDEANLAAFRRLSWLEQRNAHLLVESDRVLKQEEFAEFFWKLQETRFANLLARAVVGETTTKQLFNLYTHCEKLAAYEAVHLQPENHTQAGTHETGKLRTALDSMDEWRRVRQQQSAGAATHLFKTQAEQMKTQCQAAYKFVEIVQSKGNAQLKHVKSARQQCNEAWLKWQHQNRSRTKMESENQASIVAYRGAKSQQAATHIVDPWLAATQYARDVAALRAVEESYAKEMTQLFQSTVAEDASRINATTASLLTVLQAQKAAAEAQLQQLNSCIDAVQRVDTFSDSETFLQLGQLVPSPDELQAAGVTKDATSCVFALPSPSLQTQKSINDLIEIEVEKSGSLDRQGAFVKSNWKSSTATVTRSGYLHIAGTDGKSIKLSIHLYDCFVALCAGNILQVELKSQGYFSSKPMIHMFRASDRKEAEEFVKAIAKVGAERQPDK